MFLVFVIELFLFEKAVCLILVAFIVYALDKQRT